MKPDSLRALTALLLLSLLAACSTAPSRETSENYDRQFNFAGVKTIYIAPFSRTDAATITVSDEQVRHIDSALSTELARKGLTVVTDSARADLFLTWYLVTEDEVKVGPGGCPGCDNTAGGGYRFAKGTLIVDMVDPMRNQPVWRSVLQTELTAQPSSAEAEQHRQAAAAEIFARFPPQ